jgi:hypothetical protein
MPAPYSGGCQCGAIRYTLRNDPLTLYVCHCTECQKQSSSAFGMSMTVLRTDVDITQGTLATFERPANHGHRVECTYCADCGSRLFHATSRRPDHMNIKPGTLDDTQWLKPVAHVWTGSAQPWVTIPNDMLTFSAQPPSHDPLVAAYRAAQT